MAINIASERVKAGYDQEELAKKLGTSVKTVSRWENGEMPPYGQKLVEMRKLFNCSIDYLLGVSEDRIAR